MSFALTPEQLDALKRCDTCSVANAIETFQVRLRNEGFTNGSLRCVARHAEPMVGYAATVRMKSSNPPPEGQTFEDRAGWISYIQSLPSPRIMVIQDMDEQPCAASFAGASHAHVWQALGCIGIVTNGALRDIPLLEETSLHLYAGGLAPSHGFAHIVDFGRPVTIAGLEVTSGDLLHGDVHGIVTVPKSIAPQVPSACAAILARERQILDLCRTGNLSAEALCEILRRP